MALNEQAHDFEARARLLARLARTLLAEQAFESLPDLTEALKCRCARLRITWTPEDITQAYRVIESNTPLPGAPRRRVRLVREPTQRARALNSADMTRFYKELRRHVGAVARIRTMPSAPWSDPDVDARERQAARERAWDMGIEL
jgi:hypothetical protein